MSVFLNSPSFRLLPLVLLMPAGGALAAEAMLPVTVVTASRISQPLSQVIGDVSVIDRAELERYSGESVLEVLKKQSGMQIASNGVAGKLSGIFLRGTNSTHTLVLIDGVRYGSLTAGTPSLEHMQAEQIERVEILRGAAASLYGADAIGGVIQIFTRQGSKTPSVSLKVAAGSENSKQASLSAGGQFGETRAAMTIAHSKTDGTSAISNPSNSNFFADEDGYQNNSISLNAQHKFNDQHQASFVVLAAQSETQYDGSFLNPITYTSSSQSYDYRSEHNNGAASISSVHHFFAPLTTRLKIGQSIDNTKSYSALGENDFRDDIGTFDSKQTQYNIQNDLKLPLGVAVLGIEHLTQRAKTSMQYDAPLKTTVTSAQLGYVATINQFNIQANLRSDDYSRYGRQNNYSIGSSFDFTPQINVGFIKGTAFRAPTFNELYWPEARKNADYFVGNPNLKPEESDNSELFFAYTASSFRSKLNLFNNKLKNLASYDGATLQTINLDRAIMRGATLTFDGDFGQYAYGATYNYLKAEDRSGKSSDGQQLARRAKDTGVVYAGFDRHNVGARLEVQAVGKRFTDQYTPKPLRGYALLNLSGKLAVTPEVTLGLRINNVLDQKYESVKDYGTLGTNGLLSLTFTPKL